MPVAHWTPKHSGTGQMHFARFLNNGLIKRLMLKTIILSEEDAQEHCVFRYIHLAFSYALRVEITVAQSRLLLLLRLLRLEGDGEEDRTRYPPEVRHDLMQQLVLTCVRDSRRFTKHVHLP